MSCEVGNGRYLRSLRLPVLRSTYVALARKILTKLIIYLGSYGYEMTPCEMQVIFRVERCGTMIPDAKFLILWRLESLRVQFRYVMAPKINEMIHLMYLTMTVLSVCQLEAN